MFFDRFHFFRGFMEQVRHKDAGFPFDPGSVKATIYGVNYGK